MAKAVGSKENNPIYVGMMVDSLCRKESVLSSLYDLTQKQHDILSEKELDEDAFMRLLDEKGVLIEEINDLDSGFDRMYHLVQLELTSNLGAYSDEIERMKSSIESITNYSTSIQVLEKKNYERFQRYIAEQKEQVRKANLNQKSVSSYSQNMGAADGRASYFFNESK